MHLGLSYSDWNKWWTDPFEILDDFNGGAYVPNPCAEDDQFGRDLYPMFLEKSRSTGIPAVAYWFGNIVVVSPDGTCRRAGSYPTNKDAINFWSWYGRTVSPLWAYEGNGSPKWVLYTSEGAKKTPIIPVGPGLPIEPGPIGPPAKRAAITEGTNQTFLWVGGAVLLVVLLGQRR